MHFKSMAGSPRGLLGDNLSAYSRKKEGQCTQHRGRDLNQKFSRSEAEVQRMGPFHWLPKLEHYQSFLTANYYFWFVCSKICWEVPDQVS